MVRSTDYKFSSTPAFSLSTGAEATMSLPNVAGINAASPNRHYLRITNSNPSLSETVLITAFSGASFKFTPANSHSAGAWSISSATAGLQEAFYDQARAVQPSDIVVPYASSQLMYGKLWLYGFGGSTVSIRGVGQIASTIVRHSSYPSGDLVFWDGSIAAGELQLQNLTIKNASGFNQPSGAGLRLASASADRIFLDRITVEDGHLPIYFTGTGELTLEDVTAEITSAYTAAYATTAAFQNDGYGVYALNCQFLVSGSHATAGDGMLITSSDGNVFTSCFFTGYCGIRIKPTTARIFNFAKFSNCLIDSYYAFGVLVDSTTPNAVLGQIEFATCQVVQTVIVGLATATGIYVNNVVRGFKVIGGHINGNLFNGIELAGGALAPHAVSIIGVDILNNNNGAGLGSGIVVNPPDSYRACLISGNMVNNGLGSYPYNANQARGIYLTAGAHNGLTITGNDLASNTGIAYDPGVTFANTVIESNGNVTNGASSMAAASSIDVGMFPTAILSGTTVARTITPAWEGRHLTVIFTNVAPGGLGSGGNIGRVAAATQNVPIHLVYTSGAWF